MEEEHPCLGVFQCFNKSLKLLGFVIFISIIGHRTYWCFLNRFCSIPEWFPLIRRMACARSFGVKKCAVKGLSGKKK
jgi:hypothetical protein